MNNTPSIEELIESSKTNHHIRDTKIGNYRVSTILLGLNYPFGSNGPSLLFQTMVFPVDKEGNIISPVENYCRRYSTKEKALEGHIEIVVEYARNQNLPIPSAVLSSIKSCNTCDIDGNLLKEEEVCEGTKDHLILLK